MTPQRGEERVMVSEAEVEAAAKAIYHHPRAPLQMTSCKELARAALEAAERVREMERRG